MKKTLVKMKWLFEICIASIIFCQIISQHVDILTSAKTCPNENMIFIPADDNSTTWICECILNFLYFPGTDSCHEPYKRGPCPPENYLVLPSGEKIARCEKNPCLEDGLVPFQKGCHFLEKNGPPCDEDNSTYLLVDSFNFELSCSMKIFHLIVNAPLKTCANGSRRISTGVCKHILE